jgi:hypothetical protein
VDPSTLNNVILTVRNQVESSGKKIPVSMTEWTAIDLTQIDIARKGIWAIAMGGGTYEIHLNIKKLNVLDDLNKWDTLWKQANILRQFMENISYYEMTPNNSIITSRNAFALEKSGERYVAYLYNGGSVTVDLSSASGTLEAEWYNPRNGTYYDERTVTGGCNKSFTPPFSGDAVLHVFNISARWESRTPAEMVNSQPLAGQIIVYPNTKSWLAYNRDSNGDGKKDPFFLCGLGDPEDFLYRGTCNVNGTRNGDQMKIINKLNGTGANSIYMQAIRSHGGDGDYTHNPFVDSDPTKTLNENILNQWETWFTEMDNNGIVIFLVLYDDNMTISETGYNSLGWPLDNSGNLHPQERYYIEAIVKRFGHHRHLIWCVMEQVEEMGTDYIEHAKKIAEAIRQSDDHDHVISVHKRLNGSFYEFEDDPNFDQFIPEFLDMEGSISGFHDGMVSYWNTARGRYNINMQGCKGLDSSDTTHVRKGCWAIAMGGGYILIAHINPFERPTSLFQDCGRLVRFMESINLSEMAPHDEVVTSGTGYCLANLGSEYVIYLPDGSSVTVDLSDATGALNVEWYDPKDGTYYDEGTVIGGGNESFTSPFSGDALLYIVSTAFEAGGDTYPSISGTHTGTIKPSNNITHWLLSVDNP